MSQKQRIQAFAIVRIDDFLSSTTELRNRIKVKRILWNQHEAEEEVKRLQAEAGEGCTYFWQTTKVDPKIPGETQSETSNPEKETAESDDKNEPSSGVKET